MLVFAMVYVQTGTLPAVVSAFSGLQAVVIAVVVNAVISFGKTTVKSWKHALIAAAAFLMFYGAIHPLLVILLTAGLGWLILPLPNTAEIQGGKTAATPFYKKSILLILVIAAFVLAIVFLLSKDLFNLALLMIRVDLMAFGGGFASVPIMFHEVVEVNHWLNSQTFMNGIILGQATPGPIVITATFIGYFINEIPGAIIASICIFLPSFLLVVGISPFFNRLSQSPVFHKIIRGVLCSFVGLLISVAIKFGLAVHWDWIHILLVVGALAALLRKIDILWVVLFGTILSIFLIR